MAGQRAFNITGPCVSDIHYMVDIGDRIAEIINVYIDKGEYITINRARQYGKTTTLKLLSKQLKHKYIVIDLSFEGKDEYFASIATLAEGIRRRMYAILAKTEAELSKTFKEPIDAAFPMSDLTERVALLSNSSEKPIVLIIDEVDKASDNQVFLTLLGALRDMYIEQAAGNDKTFKSVVLAGVRDIKNLKLKLRPEAKHGYNSPWNIAARFDVDMSFAPSDIATMLCEYERDNHTGMDVAQVAERVYYYTRGYPYLVSYICKVINDNKLEWSARGADEAFTRVVKDRNTLFDDMTKNLANNESFSSLIKRILLGGARIAFEDQNPDIDMGLMYGIFAKDADGFVKVANIIFETRIYNYFVSIEATNGNFDNVASEKSLFIRDGKLDMPAVLERFRQLMRAEYRDENGGFIEKHAALLFLCFVKPIINRCGHYVVEPETRGGRRMDIIVFYGAEEHIVELKIWRGERYERQGVEQLAEYLDCRGRKRGYLLSFCFNKTSPRAGRVYTRGDLEIFEVIVDYCAD